MLLPYSKWCKDFSISTYLLTIVFVAFAGLALADPASRPGGEESPEDTIQMGSITIHKITKQVSIRVRTAIDQGVLEYLLVGDHGKAYESAFKVDNSLPSKLNFALLLIGIEPLDYNKAHTLARNENGIQTLLTNHKNSLVRISLHKGGNAVDLSRVIHDREESASQLIWVFTGSRFTRDGRYLGDITLSYIGIWPDSSAVVNLFSGRGNPYQGEFGFVMNEENQNLKKDQEYELILESFKQ